MLLVLVDVVVDMVAKMTSCCRPRRLLLAAAAAFEDSFDGGGLMLDIGIVMMYGDYYFCGYCHHCGGVNKRFCGLDGRER